MQVESKSDVIGL